MQEDNVEKIKNRLEIEKVIGEYVKLQKSGPRYKACCPFHNEKTPSFVVSPSLDIWKCFGCGEGGDIFSFVEKIEGVQFYDAMKILASKAGIELSKNITPASSKQRNDLFNICSAIRAYFHHQLKTPQGKIIHDYLNERGISDKSIKDFQIGYAPTSSSEVINFLRQEKYSPDSAIKAGILYRRGSGYVNRFAGRIIFPITSPEGKTVGFGGRKVTEQTAKKMKEVFDENSAKYVNTTNTPIYDKSKVLYGFYKAKNEIRKRDVCIIVEGYTDVILAHSVGCTNVVASSGTALTDLQLRIIGRFTKNIITAFDMDIAGNNATQRGIKNAQKIGFSIKVASMPKDKDPADVIIESKKLWDKAIEEAQSIINFYFSHAFDRYDSFSPEGKKNISKMMAPILASVENSVERSHWVKECAGKLGVLEESVWDEVKKINPEKDDEIEDIIVSQDLSKDLSREENIFYSILSILKKDTLKIQYSYDQIKDIPVDNILLQFLKKCDTISGNRTKKFEIFDLLDEDQKIDFKNILLKEEVIDNKETSLEALQSLIVLYKQAILKKELQELQMRINRDKNNPDILNKVKIATELLNKI